MAKRKYSARSKKQRNMQPAAMTLNFPGINTAPNSASVNYIDLSQVASLVNRRFYRQGINWAVGGFKILSDGKPVALVISKLPNTWVMSNAWEKSMRTWTKMNREALAEAESVRPRFLDFKVYMDSTHHQLGFAGNLLPASAGATPATAGEWESSKFLIPDSTSPAGAVYSREVIATGANYPGPGASGLNAISMIEGYAASRALPNVLDPNTPDDAGSADGAVPQNWMSALFNDGTSQTEEVLEDMIAENNLAPYPFENDGIHTDTMYPGGANQLTGLQLHDIEYVTGTTIGGTTRMKGGNFPCGLIQFVVSNSSLENSSQLTLLVDLVPGHHRGYLCEPMTEM
ncbi:MAG: hypothetical protein [Circular genetic element sp.]|nr:MAG: hypothetical protein [Circular genetic element sp.]